MPPSQAAIAYNRNRSPRQRAHADTVLKPTANLAITHIPTKANLVDEMVQHELQDNTHLAATDNFLDRLLRVHEGTVDAIYQKLVGSKAYDPAKAMWRNFPEPKSLESSLYKPVTDAANAVNGACAALNLLSPGQVQSSWLDRHSTAPKSRDPDAPAIRPDIVSVLGVRSDLDTLEKKIQTAAAAAEEEEEEKKKKKKKDKEGVKETNETRNLTDKVTELAQAWWHRVHVPVEIKPAGDDNAVRSAVRQLCGYMRQVLREQLDRRFVFGLALCAENMSVWFCDRSGLVGTESTFNIHQEPKKFIQVIAALALLEPDRLGYDLSMQLYRPQAEHCYVHSWHPSVTVDDFGENAYRTYWAIEMPGRDGETRERFITIRGLSLVKSEIMCGRATLVWECVKDTQEIEDKYRRYVLKHCWRPETSHREAHFYKHQGSDNTNAGLESVGTVYSSEDVQIDDRVDSTFFLRQHLDLDVDQKMFASGEKQGKRPRDETTEPFVLVKTTTSGVHFGIPSASEPVPRILSRMLMDSDSYGWPIKFFKDIPELLRVFRDAISGHRALYYRGVLHRDISAGNILICPKDDNAESTRGKLIDLDYAKLTAEFTDPAPITRRQDWNTTMESIYKILPVIFPDVHVGEDAFNVLWMRYKGDTPQALGYIKSYGEKIKKSLTMGDMSLYHIGLQRPDFSAHKSQVVPRTATLPFASGEILSNARYSISGRVVHDSIHDMESFFWVLLYLCLTREGPGGHRRAEFKDGNAGGLANSLEQIVYCFFDSDIPHILASNRKLLFDNHEDMKDYVVEQFHPYFHVLKPLVVEWWRLLHFEYAVASYTPMHEPLLASLDKTIEEVAKMPPSPPSAATLAEVKRRKADLARVHTFRKMQEDAGVSFTQQSAGVDAPTSPFRAQHPGTTAGYIPTYSGASVPSSPSSPGSTHTAKKRR